MVPFCVTVHRSVRAPWERLLLYSCHKLRVAALATLTAPFPRLANVGPEQPATAASAQKTNFTRAIPTSPRSITELQAWISRRITSETSNKCLHRSNDPVRSTDLGLWFDHGTLSGASGDFARSSFTNRPLALVERRSERGRGCTSSDNTSQFPLSCYAFFESRTVRSPTCIGWDSW